MVCWCPFVHEQQRRNHLPLDPMPVIPVTARTWDCLKSLQEKKLDESVKNSAKDFQAVKMKANMVTGVVNLFVLNRLLATFEGVTGTHSQYASAYLD